MKISFNMIRVGLTTTLCAGLLAACDNRSATPFKSKAWSAEETLANKKIQDAANGVKSDSGAPSRGVEQQPLPNGESPLATPPAAPSASNGAGDKSPSVDVGGAQSKFPVEFLNREKEQAKTGKFGELTNTVNELIKKRLDPDAGAMVPMISIDVESNLTVTIKAALNLNGKPEYLLVNKAPLLPPTKEGELIPLAAELHQKADFSDAKHEIGNSLYVWAFCSSDKCDTIYVILDMKHASGNRRNALFVLSKDSKYAVAFSNIVNDPKEIKAFDLAAAAAETKEEGTAQEKGEKKAGEGENALPKSDKTSVDKKDETNSSDPASAAGTAGKDAQNNGSTEPAKAAAKASDFFPSAGVNRKDARLLGAEPDVTKRGVPATKVNLAELSMNKNVKPEFKVTPKSGEANTKSVLFSKVDPAVATFQANKASVAAQTQQAAAKPLAMLPREKTATAATTPARLDVTQIVKSRPADPAIKTFEANKALVAAQQQQAAAKPLAMLPRTTTTAATTTTTTNQALRTRARAAQVQREANKKATDEEVKRTAEAQ